MPALNFRKQFADLIVSGKKRQTIRPLRKRPIKPGDNLYLYTGMRTKQCRGLGNVVCKTVWPIEIDPVTVLFKNKELNYSDMMQLIKQDGFLKHRDFFKFFEKQYGFPFKGVVIRW